MLPKTIESKIAKNIQYIKDPVDLGDRIENALMGFIWKAEKGMDKIGEKLRTRVSSILHKAATEKEVNLNYAHTLEEKAARYNFGRIVKRQD